MTVATSTTSDALQESSINGYWNVDGGWDLSDARTGFTRFTMLDVKPPDGYTWSRERLTKKTRIIQARSPLARNIVKDVQISLTKREARMGNRDVQTRQCEEVRHLFYWSGWSWVQRVHLKTRKKLEVPTEVAMSGKVRKTKCKEIGTRLDARKSKYACIVAVNESTRQRPEGIQHKIMRIIWNKRGSIH